MDHIDRGDQIAGTASTEADQAGITKNTMRERSPSVPLTRPGGISDVEWQEQQAHARQPGATAVLGEDEDDGTPDALLNKGGVSKGFDVAGLGRSST
jgi:hypothetical protein